MKRKLYLLLTICVSFAHVNAQNIGIGTANPDYSLDINGTLGINDFIYHNDDGNDTWIGFPANNSWEVVLDNKRMIFGDGGAKEFTINPDNVDVDFIIVADGIEHLIHAKTNEFKVGIGTTNPDYLLDVEGSMGIADFIIHNDDIDTKMGFPADDIWELQVKGSQLIKADGAAKELIINPGNDDVDFIILADGIEHLFHVDSYNKLVGIGTASPSYFLDIKGDFRIIGDQIEHLLFADVSTNRVGIGTDSPTAALDVVGGVKVDELTIGATTGTSLQALQSGSVVVTGNSLDGEAILTSISFPNNFAGLPLIIATAYNISGPNTDAFAVTVTSLSQTGAILSVQKVATASGWTDDIQINWMAWE